MYYLHSERSRLGGDDAGPAPLTPARWLRFGAPKPLFQRAVRAPKTALAGDAAKRDRIEPWPLTR